MNILQFTAVVHDELQKMIYPVCNSVWQAAGVSAFLTLADFRIGKLAAQYQDEADMLGLIDKKTGEVNLAAVEYVILNTKQLLTLPQQIGPFKFDKAAAEKIMAAVKAQDQALKGQSK